MKVSFSLGKVKTDKPVGVAPSLKRPAVFASLEDDDPLDAAPAIGSAKSATNKQPVAQNVGPSKTTKKRMEEEQKADATVFEYDGVWDKMQEAKMRQKLAKESDAKERKPKYINNLLVTATTRRLDHLRAEEKLIQREREAEGDEFADKEAFVTQAYKDQMAEVRRAEQEEKVREAKERKGGMGTGMAHFYRKLLEDSEQQHEETVAATSSKLIIGPQGPTPNLTITKPLDFTNKSDLELAKQAREAGKDVELNDDNQIVDKRELLSAGLNLAAPNTRKLGAQVNKSKPTDEPVNVHRAVGTAASRREINERRAQEIAKQLDEERDRLIAEKHREEQESLDRVILKRNTEESVMSARERYLARKRQKLEEHADSAGEGQPH